MHPLSKDYLADLLNNPERPCLSLYQPTHRHYPDNQQDSIRFGNLVDGLEQSLRRKYSAREVHPLLQPYLKLAEDREFWNHTFDGLAVFGAPNLFRVYRLQRQVAELVVVADSFHIKPLLRIQQSADRYQVLAVNRRQIKLYEGNRDALDEIEPAPRVPRTITDALGEELTEPHLTVASYGAGASGPAMRHGHGSKKDEVKSDTERFFRAVDRAVLEFHSQPTGLPLILAALPEHHSVFRQVSQNQFLMTEAIDIHPDALTAEAFRDRAWQVVEPQYLALFTAWNEEFAIAMSKGLGSDDLTRIAEAALAGRIGTVLIEAERCLPGRIDPASGSIARADLTHPEVDDLLDDLGQLVAQKGGRAVIVPTDRMPTQSGAAAIFRF